MVHDWTIFIKYDEIGTIYRFEIFCNLNVASIMFALQNRVICSPLSLGCQEGKNHPSVQ
jgi:hypothetical protein